MYVYVYIYIYVYNSMTCSYYNMLHVSGHPPHADNVQFDSVWWDGQQIKQRDELAATRDGAHVLWKDSKTNYRNYSATVALSEPWEYGGGDLEFFRAWGEKEPCETYRQDRGDGMVFCGCQKNIHAVTGAKSLCIYIYIYIYILFISSEKGEVPRRGVGTLRYLFILSENFACRVPVCAVAA